ncbi:MAG: ABC transporter permease [Deltaproteobacteria bacterium]|nr:MAG: ABC transporter permease [Deltaproteobacteria bacterium]
MQPPTHTLQPIERQPWSPIGLRALFAKEVRRFAKVWLQTVFSPLITTSLYFLVFGVALGTRMGEIHGVPYIRFVIPGLMMLAMISNAFLNCSSSLFQSRINGTITDILVSPLGTAELLGAFVGAGVLRGLIVGSLVWLVAAFFVSPDIHHAGWMLYFSVTVCLSFAMLGLAVACLAQKYDHLAIVPSFVLTPMTFLGGVFYSIDMLPEPWRSVSLANPMLYMVNGLRYGLVGSSDVPILTAALAVLLLVTASTTAAAWLLARGRNLRT